MAEEPENDVQNPKEGKGGKKKLFLFSGVGLAVVIGAAFLFVTLAVPKAPEGGEAEASRSEGDGTQGGANGKMALDIYDIPVIMVNLKGTNKKRILKLHLNVMYESPTPETAPALFEQKMPEVKDVLTTLLTEKSLEQMEGKDDLNMLRMELLDEINRVVFSEAEGRITKVYYEEFLVQ